jgi:hypothetical protein
MTPEQPKLPKTMEASEARMPRHPPGKIEKKMLHNELHRLSTFRNWNYAMSKTELAKSGFYYYNQGDACQCIYCLVIVYAWKDSDVANLEHKKWSPRCPFMLGLPVGNIPSEGQGTDETRTPNLSSLTEPYKSNFSSPDIRPNAIPERYFPAATKEPDQIMKESKDDDGSQFKARLETFALWPKLQQTKEEMARAGFYYTGFNDQVQCPSCNITVNSWTPDEKPLTLHVLMSPHCSFVTKLLNIN